MRRRSPTLLLAAGAAVMYGIAAAPGTPTAAGTRVAPASAATVSPRATVNLLDCNGYSRAYHLASPSMPWRCVDPRAVKRGEYGHYPNGNVRFYDNGHYVGHDEPALEFQADTAGSANNLTYFAQVPTDPSGAPSTSASSPITSDYAELGPAMWFGLPLCDARSWPTAAGPTGGVSPCTPDSDSNHPSLGSPGTGAGSAAMELQFYPPGYGPAIDGISCSQTKVCAALNIDSLELVCGSDGFCNPNANCAEPVNFAFLTVDGKPTGPPSPQLANASTFTANADTLLMSPGDTLRVEIFDTSAGVETKVDDLSSNQSGFMIASSGNGFMDTDPGTCKGAAYSFRPEYSTAGASNVVPWAQLQFGVLASQEIGHFEACGSLANNFPVSMNAPGSTFTDSSLEQTCNGGFDGTTGESCTGSSSNPCAGTTQDGAGCSQFSGVPCEDSDALCFPSGSRTVTLNGQSQSWSWPVDGCTEQWFQNGDLDFDGSSYVADWPDGDTTHHPTSWKILGPFDPSGAAYPDLQFQTNVPAAENGCDTASGSGCTAPPYGASFYPFWSTETTDAIAGLIPTVSGACYWNFGADATATSTDFSQDSQYGLPNTTDFPGLLQSGFIANPAIRGACPYIAEANAAPSLPVVSGVSPIGNFYDEAGPTETTVNGGNFSGTFNANSYTTEAVQLGTVQITNVCNSSPPTNAPCFTVDSSSQLSLWTGGLSPPPGTYDVIVVTSAGGSASNGNDQYTAEAFHHLYQLDAYGGTHSIPVAPGLPLVSSPPAWNFKIARGIALQHSGHPGAGYVLDGWGGIHPFGGAPAVTKSTGYWPGKDLTRGIVLLPNDTGGYVVDSWGGLHPFAVGGNALPPAIHNGPYWPNTDTVRGIVLQSGGTGGYILDDWGGVHEFGTAAHLRDSSYWPGKDIARSLVLDPDDNGGQVLDDWGGLHAFGNAPFAHDSAYWPGVDIARSVVLYPVVIGQPVDGWVLDGWGGVHPVGAAPRLGTVYYTPGDDDVRFLAVN